LIEFSLDEMLVNYICTKKIAFAVTDGELYLYQNCLCGNIAVTDGELYLYQENCLCGNIVVTDGELYLYQENCLCGNIFVSFAPRKSRLDSK